MTSTTTADAQVSELIGALVAAWDANDGDAFADLHTEDTTVVVTTGDSLAGREELRAFMRAGYAGRLGGTRLLDEPESLHFATPDVAIAVRTGGILMAGEDALPADRKRRVSWVLVRGAGGWLVSAYHNCAV